MLLLGAGAYQQGDQGSEGDVDSEAGIRHSVYRRFHQRFPTSVLRGRSGCSAPGQRPAGHGRLRGCVVVVNLGWVQNLGMAGRICIGRSGLYQDGVHHFCEVVLRLFVRVYSAFHWRLLTALRVLDPQVGQHQG